jgi:peptidoglycan hydrolase CwlO-like protein
MDLTYLKKNFNVPIAVLVTTLLLAVFGGYMVYQEIGNLQKSVDSILYDVDSLQNDVDSLQNDVDSIQNEFRELQDDVYELCEYIWQATFNMVCT